MTEDSMQDDYYEFLFSSESKFPLDDNSSPASDLVVVYDEEEECPYLPDRLARMPLRFPIADISSQQAERLLANGFRRSGRFLYETECRGCTACEAIRLPIANFHPNRSQKRTLKKGNTVFEVEIEEPSCVPEKVHLFNKHRNQRGLNRRGNNIDLEEYSMFLVESCFESFEIVYRIEGKLVGVAICDRAENSVSAVYTYYDPEFQRFSPGTYSILKQIEYCRRQQLEYLYLGYYVEDSPHMNYKQNFRPHERLRDQNWEMFS